MKKQILKILSNSFLISLICSIIISLMSYNNTIGNEAKQVTFFLIIINIVLCILNFICALPGLLNLNEKINRNGTWSFLSFFTLPIALFYGMLYLLFQNLRYLNFLEILSPLMP